MATRTTTKKNGTARRAGAQKAPLARAVSKTKQVARTLSSRARAVTPKTKKRVAAAAAGLAVVALAARMMTRKKKKSLW